MVMVIQEVSKQKYFGTLIIVSLVFAGELSDLPYNSVLVNDDRSTVKLE